MEIRRERLWPRIGWSYESEIFIDKKKLLKFISFSYKSSGSSRVWRLSWRDLRRPQRPSRDS